jgi:hypothetical protein
MPEDTIKKIKKTASDAWDYASSGRMAEDIRGNLDRRVRSSVRNMRATGDMPGYRSNMMGTPVSKSVGENISDTWEDLKRGAKGVYDEASRKILGSKRKGGRVKKTGSYRLHRGEKVRRGR